MRRAHVTLLGLLAIILFDAGCFMQQSSRSVSWEELPWADDCPWAGVRGVPAVFNKGDLILPGWYLRTKSSYSLPLTIECNVMLEQQNADDGCIWIDLFPVGQPANLEPTQFLSFSFGYGYGSSKMAIVQRYQRYPLQERKHWEHEMPKFEAGRLYRLRLQYLPDRMRINIDGQSYDLPSLTVPYGTFQVTLRGWQPTNRWHVRNFSIY
jgi:hypothetical protein